VRSLHVNFNMADLEVAVHVLGEAGCETHTPPPHMLARGVLLAAWRPATGDGFLLTDAEVRLLAHYQDVRILDDGYGDGRARWERPGTANREQAYIEAALARAVEEVAAAPVGTRNAVLVRAAYSLGGLEHLGLDRERAILELAQAAVAAGLGQAEAQYTAKRGFVKGAEQPRELPEPGYSETWAGTPTKASSFARFFCDEQGPSGDRGKRAKDRSP
jgi:hypothetical protein